MSTTQQKMAAMAVVGAAIKKQIDRRERLRCIARAIVKGRDVKATKRMPSVIFAAAVAVEKAKKIGRVPRFKIEPAYNGGPLMVGKYDLPIIIDLKGLTKNEQSVQAVLFHEETRLVGHVDTVRNSGRRLDLAGACSGLASVVSEFVGSAMALFPWKASVEVAPLERPEHVPAGSSVSVNGQRFDGPVLVARRAELYGVSFVPRGADDSTNVVVAKEKAAK